MVASGTLDPIRLLQLSSLVLEPNLALVLIETKLDSETPSPFLGQVPIDGELLLQPLQLIRTESFPRPFVRGTQLLYGLLSHLPSPWARAWAI